MCRLSHAVALGLLAVATPALAASEPARTAFIEAEVIEVDLDDGVTHARGDARLLYEDVELRADRLAADRRSGRVDASGNLELLQADRRLAGESVEYNLRTSEGSIERARAEEQGVIVSGERIVFGRERIVAHGACFTTCDRPQPHYAFRADTITLTSEEAGPGETPTSGQLSFDRARVEYRGRSLFTVPYYSVRVGELGRPGGAPTPVTGFNRDDGPFATIEYSLGQPGSAARADFSYRYTSFRGIRGRLMLRHALGPAELRAGYIRREDAADRELATDDLEAALADVLVDRRPEYGLVLHDAALGRWLTLQGEWLRGHYSERLTGAEADLANGNRTTATVLLSSRPYSAAPGVTLSHALGWRRSSYYSGADLTVRLHRHTAEVRAGPRLWFSLSHVTRNASGDTPFLFDSVGPGRELMGEVGFRVTPGWRLRVADYYDLEANRTRDMIVEATRVAHCLTYTLGWRKERGSFYAAVGIAPVSAEGAKR